MSWTSSPHVGRPRHRGTGSQGEWLTTLRGFVCGCCHRLRMCWWCRGGPRGAPDENWHPQVQGDCVPGGSLAKHRAGIQVRSLSLSQGAPAMQLLAHNFSAAVLWLPATLQLQILHHGSAMSWWWLSQPCKAHHSQALHWGGWWLQAPSKNFPTHSFLAKTNAASGQPEWLISQK